MKLLFALLASIVSGLAHGQSSQTLGTSGEWSEQPLLLSGKASFYGKAFGGHRTASGENYDHQTVSAASNRFPLGSLVAVRRVLSARCVVVRINDRMGHRRRVIDLSREAAVRLGMIDAGVTDVDVALLPKYLVGHEQACKLAFSPPVHLHAIDGQGSDQEKR